MGASGPLPSISKEPSSEKLSLTAAWMPRATGRMLWPHCVLSQTLFLITITWRAFENPNKIWAKALNRYCTQEGRQSANTLIEKCPPRSHTVSQ